MRRLCRDERKRPPRSLHLRRARPVLHPSPLLEDPPIGTGRVTALTHRAHRRGFPAVNSACLKQDVWKVSGQSYDQPWQMSLHGTWQPPEPRLRVGTLPSHLKTSGQLVSAKSSSHQGTCDDRANPSPWGSSYTAACSSVADVRPAPSCPPIGASVERLEPAWSAPHPRSLSPFLSSPVP